MIARLIESAPYQFKFVVDQPSDLDDVCQYLTDWPQVSGDRVSLGYYVFRRPVTALRQWLGH